MIESIPYAIALLVFTANCFVMYGMGFKWWGAIIIASLIWISIGLIYAGIAMMYGLKLSLP